METIFLIAVGIFALPLLWFVHLGLDRCCVFHARRWCRRHKLEVLRLRWGPAFDHTGLKTEFTWVDLDCRDEHGHRTLRRLRVWAFGVREVASVLPVAAHQE